MQAANTLKLIPSLRCLVSHHIDDCFDDVTAVFSLPLRYRKRLRTNNRIERPNQEIRRRERVI